jgi:hypothetical protein
MQTLEGNLGMKEIRDYNRYKRKHQKNVKDLNFAAVNYTIVQVSRLPRKFELIISSTDTGLKEASIYCI